LAIARPICISSPGGYQVSEIRYQESEIRKPNP
jgi:hypothetical protein